MKGWGGLYMNHSGCLSIFIYKPWLVNEGGSNMRVAYPMNLLSDKNKPRSNISHTASSWKLTVSVWKINIHCIRFCRYFVIVWILEELRYRKSCLPYNREGTTLGSDFMLLKGFCTDVNIYIYMLYIGIDDWHVIELLRRSATIYGLIGCLVT